MIYNKFRKRFILLSTAIASVILLVIMAGINISSWINLTNRSDKILTQFVMSNDSPGSNQNPPEAPGFPEEYPFRDETFFSVQENGGSYNVNLDFIKSIDENDAIEYYEKVSNRTNKKGYVDSYRYIKNENSIYFLDCTKSVDVYKRTLLFSILFSVGGIATFFSCLYFGSILIYKNLKSNEGKQKQFITDASHQLKTPLMVISANVDLLSLKNGESEEIKTIEKEIEHMNSMVSKLLTISKANETIQSNFTKLSFSNILNEELGVFDPLVNKASLKLESSIEEDVYIYSDEFTTNEIIKITLDNAIKYSKTSIYVSLKRDKKAAEFIVKNDSDYQEDKNLDYLAERFTRDSNTPGSGIGLSMLKTLVENQKATLEIHSKAGLFIVTIRFKIAK